MWVRSRHFLGAQCLQSASGQSVDVFPMIFAGNVEGEYRVIRFAVATDPATTSLPPGTRIGQFRSDRSTTTTDTVQASVQLNFMVTGMRTVDIVCSNTATTVATVAPGDGNWAFISVITQIPQGSTGQARWYAYDPLTDTHKGPPLGTLFSGGMHIFVNSKTEAVHVLDSQIAPGWGNDGHPYDAEFNSAERGWKIRAMNGGSLYVDELY